MAVNPKQNPFVPEVGTTTQELLGRVYETAETVAKLRQLDCWSQGRTIGLALANQLTLRAEVEAAFVEAGAGLDAHASLDKATAASRNPAPPSSAISTGSTEAAAFAPSLRTRSHVDASSRIWPRSSVKPSCRTASCSRRSTMPRSTRTSSASTRISGCASRKGCSV